MQWSEGCGVECVTVCPQRITHDSRVTSGRVLALQLHSTDCRQNASSSGGSFDTPSALLAYTGNRPQGQMRDVGGYSC